MTTVAFVGLGAMGSRMAERLIAAGHDIIAWNRTPAKAGRLASLGARVADTPATAAGAAEVVITMVANPEALRAVTEGAHGLAAGVTEPTTVIEMSTVGPDAISRLAATLPDGVGLLDAPVLGSLPEAESGRLKIFVGGPDPLTDRWTPLLRTFGSPIHVGPSGAGAAAKLVANSTLLGVIGVLGEAVEIGDALGLSREATFDVLTASPLTAQVERRRPAIESGDYPARFALRLAHKDADLLVNAASEVGADVRLARAAQAWLADAEKAGRGDQDYSAVIAHILGSRRSPG